MSDVKVRASRGCDDGQPAGSFTQQDKSAASEQAKKRLEARGLYETFEEVQRRIRERTRTADAA